MSEHDENLSPASRALMDAVDQAIDGDTPYPDRAAFIDADGADVGRQIAEARDEDRAIVLCYADGKRLVLRPVPPAAAA